MPPSLLIYTGEAPWWVCTTLIHRKRHPGGYTRLYTGRGTLVGIKPPLYTGRGTLVGIEPFHTGRGTLVGIVSPVNPEEAPWWVCPPC